MRAVAKGTLFKIGDGGGPEVFTTVGQITNIEGPSESRGTQEASDHDTVAAKDFLADALYDGGEVSIEFHADPTLATQGSVSGLRSLLRAGTKRNMQIVFPAPVGRTFAFAGYVSAFSQSAPSDGKLMGTATVKVTGAITES